MKSLELSSIEDLQNQPEGSRYFAVGLIDPEFGLPVAAGISLTPEVIEDFRRDCPELGIGEFTDEMVPVLAASFVMTRLWDCVRMDLVTSIEELSQDDMLERRRDMEGKLKALAD